MRDLAQSPARGSLPQRGFDHRTQRFCCGDACPDRWFLPAPARPLASSERSNANGSRNTVAAPMAPETAREPSTNASPPSSEVHRAPRPRPPPIRPAKARDPPSANADRRPSPPRRPPAPAGEGPEVGPANDHRASGRSRRDEAAAEAAGPGAPGRCPARRRARSTQRRDGISRAGARPTIRWRAGVPGRRRAPSAPEASPSWRTRTRRGSVRPGRVERIDDRPGGRSRRGAAATRQTQATALPETGAHREAIDGLDPSPRRTTRRVAPRARPRRRCRARDSARPRGRRAGRPAQAGRQEGAFGRRPGARTRQAARSR